MHWKIRTRPVSAGPGSTRRALRGPGLAAVALLILLATSAVAGRAGGGPARPPVASVPTSAGDRGHAPSPVATTVPTILPSPTEPPVPPTPTIYIWPAPVPVQGISVSAMTGSADVGVGLKSTVNAATPISQFIWAPTGDKILYLTQAGDLFWANLDSARGRPAVTQPSAGRSPSLHQQAIGTRSISTSVTTLTPRTRRSGHNQMSGTYPSA